jgi:hypothetical protein
MLVALVRHDPEKGNGLHSYLYNMMQVISFDVRRRGRLISYMELNQYTRWLASSVTEAMHYFIGHGEYAPHDETRYLAVSGAHIVHMLRDTLEDIQLGYFNIPCAYLAAKGIGPKDVATVVGRSSLDNIFDLVDSIAARNTGSALKSLQQLLEGGEAPQYLLYMIARQYRLLLTVKALKAERAAPATLFKPLGTGSEYMVKKCVEQSRNFSTEALEDGLAAALRTDLRLKSTRSSTPEIELQALVATLCQ